MSRSNHNNQKLLILYNIDNTVVFSDSDSISIPRPVNLPGTGRMRILSQAFDSLNNSYH